MKLARFVPLLFLLVAAQSFAVTVYVSQSGGSVSCGADGTQSTTALASVSWVTSGTYKLCGTITSQVTVGAGGIAGTPLSILFESGSGIAPAYCPGNGCISLGGVSYVTIDGQNVGSVGSTNNGSASLGYANQQNSYGIYSAGGNTYIIIKNLHIGPVYVHDNTGNDTLGSSTAAVYITNNASNSDFTIDHNTLTYSNFNLQIDASNLTISNNTATNINWFMLEGCPTSTTCSNVYVFGNTASGFSAWDTTSGAFHHNFIHSYGDATSTINHTYVYNNKVTADGKSATSWLFFSESYVAAITLNDLNIFNNLVIAAHPSTAGLDLLSLGSNWNVWNNTLIGAYPTGSDIQGACILASTGVTGFVAQNNIVSTCGGSQMNFVSPVPVSPVADYNVYTAVNPSASYPWGYNGAQITTLAAWRTSAGGTCPSTGFDCHGSYTASAAAVLNNTTGVIVGGGPANGTGVNLYSTCNGQAVPGLGALCSDINGVARPASGPWDVGAYNGPSGGGGVAFSGTAAMGGTVVHR
jgi:hypothetical protein